MSASVADLVTAVRRHPGWLAKQRIAVVGEALGPTDWLEGPGDDAAVVGDGDHVSLVAGEAMLPAFVERDPFAAGLSAVVANVNDVAAMGGRPRAVVDTIVAEEAVARRVLQGMRRGSELYDVPLVGGHLTVRSGSPAVSAFILGAAVRTLASRRAAPGQALLLAACLEGKMRPDFPFFSSIAERGPRLAGDVRLLADLAEAGDSLAAKDVSMAGLFGSLAMLLEPSGRGVTVDLESVPRPAGVALKDWAIAFPSFAFLLCAPEERVEACRRTFAGRGLICERIGALDGTGAIRLRHGDDEATLIDLGREAVTGLTGRPSPATQPPGDGT